MLVSGDCLGAIAAHRPGLPLVWFDAHGDFHTLRTTETGSLGGMPLAMLTGLGDQSLLEACRVTPLPFTDVTHVGGSAFDAGERGRMEGLGVTVVRHLTGPPPAGPIHLHIDTDVVRTADLPCSIHPAPDGLTVDEFWEDVRSLLAAAAVLSVKTPDPRLDGGGEGAALVRHILEEYHVRRHD